MDSAILGIRKVGREIVHIKFKKQDNVMIHLVY